MVRRSLGLGGLTGTIALTLAVAAPGGAAPPSGAGGVPASPDPCRLVTKQDVTRVLGWSVTSVRKQSYDVQGETGRACFLDSPQGVVTVMVPDYGSGYPGFSAFNAPDARALVQHVYGVGASVALYNGTVYVTKHGQDASVRVVPNETPASYATIKPFAAIVAHRMR